VELPGFSFSNVEEETIHTPERPPARFQRGGRPRMGSRASAELSPEELEALLQVG
jgi:hypothetical protein